MNKIKNCRRLLLIISCILAITSCSTVRVQPLKRSTATYFVDYRKYAEEGFLISPNPYTYAFDGIGELCIEIKAAYKEIEKSKSKQFMDPFYSEGGANYESEVITYNELVDIAVQEAKSRGADALVNFRIETDYENVFDASRFRLVYKITGYCIKRK